MNGIEKLLKKISGGQNVSFTQEQIKKAISQLPEDNRKAIELYYINNLSKKEIAVQLNWSASKVDNKITRGITLLRSHLIPGFFAKADEILLLSRKTFSSWN